MRDWWGKITKLSNFFTKIGLKADMVINVLKSAPVSLPVTTHSRPQFYSLDNSLMSLLNFGKNRDISNALNECSIVMSILSETAQAVCDGEITIVNKNTLKPSLCSNANWALELLTNPNYIQNNNQFICQSIIQSMAYGYSVALKSNPLKEVFDTPTDIWALPSDLVNIIWVSEFNHKALYRTTIYDLIEQITFDGKKIPKEDVIIFTDPYLYRKSIIVPQSRLKSVEGRINSIITAVKARAKLTNSSVGIISPKNPEGVHNLKFDTAEQKLLQKQWEQSYGFKAGQSHLVFSQKAIDYTAMSSPINALDLPEGERLDTVAIAAVLGYKKELLGITDNSNVSERKESLKHWMSNTVRVIANNFFQQLNEGLGLIDGNDILYIDFSHLEIFKADQEKEAKVRSLNVVAISKQFATSMITHGRAMILLGEEVRKDLENKYMDQCPLEIQELFKNIHNSNNQNTNDSGKN
jgi:hypothetical protein